MIGNASFRHKLPSWLAFPASSSLSFLTTSLDGQQAAIAVFGAGRLRHLSRSAGEALQEPVARQNRQEAQSA
jgi:hypothetical protein